MTEFVFDIKKVEVDQYREWITAAILDAVSWLDDLESVSDGITRQSNMQWSMDRRLSGRHFAFTRRNGAIYLHALTTPRGILPVRTIPGTSEPLSPPMEYPVEHPLAWFALIPWRIQHEPFSSSVTLSFDMELLVDKSAVFSLHLTGWSRVLGVLESARRDEIPIRFAVGDGTEFIVLGWTAEFD